MNRAMPSMTQRKMRKLAVMDVAALFDIAGGVGLRDRIVTAGVPGVAAQQSAQRQDTAVQCAVRAQCLERVLRAGRIEAATRSEQRTQRQLVGADDPLQEETHDGASLMSPISSDDPRAARGWHAVPLPPR